MLPSQYRHTCDNCTKFDAKIPLIKWQVSEVLWPLYSVIIFFIDHYCAGVSNKHCVLPVLIFPIFALEPRYEKTGLRGFRPGPTQTGLYSHRRWLEA